MICDLPRTVLLIQRLLSLLSETTFKPCLQVRPISKVTIHILPFNRLSWSSFPIAGSVPGTAEPTDSQKNQVSAKVMLPSGFR